MEESGRISRGEVKKLEDIDVDSYDALIVPGGSGLLKIFSLKQEDSKLGFGEIKKTMKAFNAVNKPIALCSHAGVLASRIFGQENKGPGIEITLGHIGGSWPEFFLIGHLYCLILRGL